jgi:hypothetical protein
MIDFLVRVTPFITTWIFDAFIFGFFFGVYKRRFEKKYPYFVVFCVLTLIGIYINSFGLPLINVAYTVFYINFVGFVFFKIKVGYGILYNQLLTVVLISCEALSMAVVALNRNIPFYKLLTDKQAYALTLLVEVVITFAAVRMLILILSKKQQAQIRFSELMILFALMVFELYIINYLVNKAEVMSDINRLLVTALGFLGLNIYVVATINRVSELYKVRLDAEIIKQQNALQLSHYSEMMKNYNHYRRIAHDIRKHLNILNNLPDMENDRYKNYSKTIYDKMDLLFDEFETANQILSIVMTQKLRLAKEERIKTFTNIEDINLSFLEDIDITAIFANLWDNAIEACRDVKPDDRFINMYLLLKGDLVLIQFENSYAGELNSEDGVYLSTKGGTEGGTVGAKHSGVGLQIIREAVKKYGGQFMVTAKDGIFTTTLMLQAAEAAAVSSV